ncbi:MAG: hypothetical protein II783_07595 [Erysipelotrichales bacterium]|nr:hypothetical protein [Erysipelotrichales bacterium]
MILVVNKMSRTSQGNTMSQQEIIREALRKVLAPSYTPEQLNLSFLDAKSYLDSLKQSDPELAEELRKRSGYSEFIEVLNAFVDEKSISSKLTTEIYTSIRRSTHSTSKAKAIVVANSDKHRNITQILVSPGSKRHGDVPYVKISTSDWGKIKVVNSTKSEYITDGNSR